MNVILALVGLLALVTAAVYLARLVARDGLGTTSPPRSHREELGSWVDQRFTR